MSNNPFIPGAPSPSPAPMPGAPGSSVDDEFAVDLTDVQDQSIIPDGTYRVRCANVEQSVSKGGNPMFVWDFEIVGGTKYDGRVLKVFTAITPAAMWKVAETVQALGVGETGKVVKFKRTDVVGKECGAVVEKTEYNGNERSQISRVIPLSEIGK